MCKLNVIFRTATSEMDTRTPDNVEDHLYDVIPMQGQPTTCRDMSTSFITTARAEEAKSTPTVAESKVGGADQTEEYEVMLFAPPTNAEEESINVAQCPAYGLVATAKEGGAEEAITS